MSALAASFVLAAAGLANPLAASPDIVTPSGSATSVFRVRDAGMYRVAVDTDVDVTCTLSDSLRGDFLTKYKKCNVDALLDPGVYKLRLAFPSDANSATGRAKVVVKPFEEDETAPVLLGDGAQIEAMLVEGHQRSFWLDIKKRQHVALTVAGRTAGVVELWREGDWIEPRLLRSHSLDLGGGRQIHRWELATTLEEGRYKVVVYGAKAKVWASAMTRTRQNRLKAIQKEDALFISRGITHKDISGVFPFTIPAWGFVRFAVPQKRAAAAIELTKLPTGIVRLHAAGTSMRAPNFQRGRTGCSIYKHSKNPSCSVNPTYGTDVIIFEVAGDPGATGIVRTAPMKQSVMRDGLAVSMSKNVDFTGPTDADRTKKYFVGSFDLPPDDDDAPLSCALEELGPSGRVRGIVATDTTRLTSSIGLERSFNYRRNLGAEVWFEVGEADTFGVTSKGKLASACELFSFNENGKSVRVASGRKGSGKKKALNCEISKFLSPGRYLLRLYNGRNGVESLRIASKRAKTMTPGKSSCQFSDVTLRRKGRYRLRHSRKGRAKARGLNLRSLPHDLRNGLTLSVSKSAPLSLPMGSAGVVRITGYGAPFKCGLAGGKLKNARNGVCDVAGAGWETVRIQSDSTLSLPVYVAKAEDHVRPTLRGPTRFSRPRAKALTALSADREVFYDFAQGQQRSFALTVPRSGLYELETTGLLAMGCHVRTPTVLSVYSDVSGGRGRNCLLQGGLRPGQYLLKVTAKGRSKGRAGIILRTRKPVTTPPMRVGDKRHLPVEAGALVVTPIVIDDESANKSIQLRSRTVGPAKSTCRLEDDDGWPIRSAPRTCNSTESLPAGRYRWVHLPNPLATTREMKVSAVIPEAVLKPKKGAVTTLPLNKSVRVALQDQQRQLFSFDVPADIDVIMTLTNGMYGDLFRRRADGSKGTAVTTFGPLVARGDVGRRADRSNQTVPLKAGGYLFDLAHSRDDVGIEYRIELEVGTLAPGVTLKSHVGKTIPVVNPTTGYVRIRSEGPADVRCRLFDSSDHLVAESSHAGHDWNCAITRRLDAGQYRLVVEPEVGIFRPLTVSMRHAATRDLGSVASGAMLQPKDDTIAILLAPTAGDVVEDVVLTSDAPLSCALEERDGTVLTIREDQPTCRLLVWPGPRTKGVTRAPLVVRVWQTASSSGVRFKRKTRAVRPFAGGTLSAKNAGLTIVKHSGRYQTSTDVQCLRADLRGALQECSSTASFSKGPHIVAALARNAWPIAMREIARDGSTSVAPTSLSGRVFYERQKSKRSALHLAEVWTGQGASAAPVCRMRDGVARIDGQRCVAAVANQTASELTAFAAVADPIPAKVLRRAVATGAPRLLPRGASALTWAGESVTYKLPQASYRANVVLAPGAWAIAADSRGRATDVCRAPALDAAAKVRADAGGALPLTACTLRGKAGTLILVRPFGAKAGRARVEVVTTAEPSTARARLSRNQEVTPSGPGTLSFSIDRNQAAREVHVEGAPTLRCELLRDDGVRQAGCHQQLPATLGATLTVDHDGTPLRARVHRRGWAEVARFGRNLPKALGSKVAFGDVVPLRGALVDRTIAIQTRSVLRVHADSGVCALFSGRRTLAVDGLGGPCSIAYVVDPGPHRVMVRPFGDSALHGDLYVVQTPVVTVNEGVAESAWLSPGEERFFRFNVVADAKVGVGLQAASNDVECTLYDRNHLAIDHGCQQYVELKRGGYVLGVMAPRDGPPLSVRPVVLGSTGTEAAIPEAYLDQLRQHVEVTP